MEKLVCMLIAAKLTEAAVGSKGTNIAIDATLADGAGKQKRHEVWETFRAFHHGVSAAVVSPDWPTPKIEPGAIVPGFVAGLAKAFATPELAKLLESLVASIPKPAPVAETPPPAELALPAAGQR